VISSKPTSGPLRCESVLDIASTNCAGEGSLSDVQWRHDGPGRRNLPMLRAVEGKSAELMFENEGEGPQLAWVSSLVPQRHHGIDLGRAAGW
jgi:hypothetical protein